MDKQRRQSFSDLLRYSIDKTKWVNPSFANYQQQQWLTNYHEALAKLYKPSDFAGISDANQQENIALADIYVKERFTKEDLSQSEGKDNFDEILEQTASDEIEDLLITFDEEQKPKKINQSAVIIGAAGSGKSTLIKMLAVACSGQADQLAIAQHFGRRLMMPFILREMQLTEVKTVNDLLAVWAREFERKTGVEGLIDLETVKYFLEQGWGVVAFDGVDEIGIKYRRRIRRLVYTFKATYPDVAIFVTGRPVGFDRLPFNTPKLRLWQAIAKREGWENVHIPILIGDFPHQYVRPFDIYQVTDYVTAWYKTRYDTDKIKQEKERDSLLDELKSHTGLKTFKYRPIYLATLTYVHDVKGKLPNSQILAYESMVDAYLEVLDNHKRLDQNGCHEESAQFDRLDKLKVLEWLAHDLHHKKIGESGTEEENPFNTRLKDSEFKQWLNQLIKNDKVQIKLKITEIDELLKYFLARSGLLVQPEEGVLMFSHLSFQEFLVGSWVFRELGNNFLNPTRHLNIELFNQLSMEDTWHPVGLSFFGLQTQKQGGDFQFQIINELWIKEKIDKRKSLNSFNFISRVLKEGEHTLTADDKLFIWKYYWENAVANLNDEWLKSINSEQKNWNLWQEKSTEVKEYLQNRLTQLNDKSDFVKNELILLSACPDYILQELWEKQDNLTTRWQDINFDDELKFSLDLHASSPVVRELLKPAFSLEEILIKNELSHSLYIQNIIKQDKYQKFNKYFFAIKNYIYNVDIDSSVYGLPIWLKAWKDKQKRDTYKYNIGSAIGKQIIIDGINKLYLLQNPELALVLINSIKKIRVAITTSLKLRFGNIQNENELEKSDLKEVIEQAFLSKGIAIDNNCIINKLNQINEFKLNQVTKNSTYKDISIIICTFLYQQYLLSYTNIYFVSISQAIFEIDKFGVAYPEFAELFDKEWFPYQRLKELAKTPHPVEPIEANTHRLYHYLRYKLDQAGEDISELPENLDLKAGDSMRQWHGDEIADQYIKDFTAAGWDGQMPPHDVDRWIKEDQALEAQQKAEKDQES